MKEKKEFKKENFVVCQYCGYNNKYRRFTLYGTCLRCHKIVDPKVYLKRRLWEENHRTKLREEDYYVYSRWGKYERK